MKKFKKLWRVRGLYVYQGRLVPDYGAYKLLAATSPNHARGEYSEANKQDALLLTEMEETNNWARLGFKLYIGWFALQFIVNGVAIGWLFNYRESGLTFSRLVSIVFIGWNLMGAVGALLFRRSLLDSDLRITELMKRLTQHDLTEDIRFMPRSPVPRLAINAVFIVCAVASFLLLVLWTVVLIRYGGW